MLSRFISSALILILLALLSGCATTSDVPGLDSYQVPTASASTASLTGSKVTAGGLFGDEYMGFVAMIDLKPVNNAADNWNRPITLSPGKHTIVGEFRYSNFMARAYLPLDAKAGARYQLMIKYSPAALPDNLRYSDFWIIDLATGNPVTHVYHQQATGGKKGTIFNIPY